MRWAYSLIWFNQKNIPRSISKHRRAHMFVSISNSSIRKHHFSTPRFDFYRFAQCDEKFSTFFFRRFCWGEKKTLNHFKSQFCASNFAVNNNNNKLLITSKNSSNERAKFFFGCLICASLNSTCMKILWHENLLLKLFFYRKKLHWSLCFMKFCLQRGKKISREATITVNAG